MSEDLASIFQEFMEFVKDYPQLGPDDVVAFGAFLGTAVGQAYAAGLNDEVNRHRAVTKPDENN